MLFISSFRYDDIRFAVLRSFSYTAHYNVIDKDIVIYVVLGFSEDIAKWVTKYVCAIEKTPYFLQKKTAFTNMGKMNL